MKIAWGALGPLGLAVLLTTGACGERPAVGRQDRAALEAARAGYVAPPRVERVERRHGAVIVAGTAPAGARVRVSEGTRAYGGTAEADGRWRIEAPGAGGARLFTIVAEAAQRSLEAEGRLLVLPDGSALLLREGYGALPVRGASAGGPRITSVDVGPDGAAAVSGFAAPSVPALTRIDGVAPPSGAAVGSGAADTSGRFSIILAQPLPPGTHLLEVNTPAGAARARVSVAPPEPPAQGFAATPDPQGWRVVWRASGGGLQTTYVFGAPS